MSNYLIVLILAAAFVVDCTIPASCGNGFCNAEYSALKGVYDVDPVVFSSFSSPFGTFHYRSNNTNSALVINVQTHNIVAQVSQVKSYVAIGYDVVERILELCDTESGAQKTCQVSAAASTVYAAWILYPQQDANCKTFWICKISSIIPDMAAAYFVHTGGTPRISVGFNYAIMDGAKVVSSGPIDNSQLLTLSNGVVIRMVTSLPSYDDGFATITQSMIRLQVCTGKGHKYPGNLATADYVAPDLYGWLKFDKGKLSFIKTHLPDSLYYERTSQGGVRLVDLTKNIKKAVGGSAASYDNTMKVYSWPGCGRDMLYSVPSILRYSLNVTAIEIPVVSTAGYASNLTVVNFNNGTIEASFGVTDGNYLVTYSGNGISISLEYLTVTAGYYTHTYDVDFLGILCVESTTSVCFSLFDTPSSSTIVSDGGTNTDSATSNSIADPSGLGMTISLAISAFGCFVVTIISLGLSVGCRNGRRESDYTKVSDD